MIYFYLYHAGGFTCVCNKSLFSITGLRYEKTAFLSFRLITVNAITQIITDKREPVAVASPIGRSVAGNSLEVRYTPGTRTSTIAVILCKKDNPDFPQAQK